MGEKKCQAVALFCIDFRLQLTALVKLMESIGYPEGTYDHPMLAGAGKDLLSANISEVDHSLKQIRTSVNLHQAKEIIILMHDNCGAYGISNPEIEDEVQKEHLKAIAALLKEKFPQVIVKTYIIKGTKTGELKPIEFIRK